MSNNENNSIIEFGVQVFSLTKYSSYQRCILMRIYKYTQKDISDAISSQKNDHLIHFTSAEESEQVRHVKIPLKRLEPIKSHYSRLRGALQNMATKLMNGFGSSSWWNSLLKAMSIMPHSTSSCRC